MRPPMSKRLEDCLSDIPPTDSKGEGYAEKVKLAQHLHDQGVNPLRWTEAHPAPQIAQQHFQKTGRKGRDDQFEVGGRLYDWAPGISATPAQAKAIAAAYTATQHDPLHPGAGLPPIEDLVDVTQVPLKHPLGTPHLPRIGASQPDLTKDEERLALYRHYTEAGIDPNNAHLGDPLPMPDQNKIKAEMAKLLPGDKTEISGLPMFYQGFDDGWIYMPNKLTQESPDVRKIRLGQADGVSANDNSPELVEQITRHYLDRDTRPEAGNTVASDEPSIAPSSGGRDKEGDATSQVEQMDKGERDNNPAGGGSPRSAIVELQSFVQNMPAVIAVVDKLQAGGPLTPAEKELQDRISTSLKKAGIEFDYTLSDLDQMREVYAQAQEELRKAQQGSKSDASGIAMAMLTLQGTQALAGGSFDAVRMMQSDSMLERLSLAFQRYMPAARKVAVPAATTFNVEAAKDGPIDYDDAFKEFRDLFVGDDSASLTAAETSAGEAMDIETFKVRLPAFDEVAIHIGDVVLIQHPHTTATDQIIIEAIVDVASSRGCEPEPDPTSPREDGKSIYGGTEGSQSRVTDIDQPGHAGSAQPDGTTNLSGHGNKGAVYVNTTSTRADLITPIVREIVSSQRLLRNIEKQLAADPKALEELRRAITRRGHVWLYGKKWGWELDKIRRHVRRKVEELYDQLYKDCLPIGEPGIFQLDDPNDPEFRE